MNENISTSLLLFDKEGKLVCQYVCFIPEYVLHKVYKTSEIYGVATDRDLIGQSVYLDFDQLVLVKAFLGEIVEGGGVLNYRYRLFTYELCSNPESLAPGMELMLSVFDKGEAHVGDIDLPLDLNLVEVRRIVGLPERHNLVGDFPLDYEWQVEYFSRYVSGLDAKKFYYVISSCSRSEGE